MHAFSAMEQQRSFPRRWKESPRTGGGAHAQGGQQGLSDSSGVCLTRRPHSLGTGYVGGQQSLSDPAAALAAANPGGPVKTDSPRATASPVLQWLIYSGSRLLSSIGLPTCDRMHPRHGRIRGEFPQQVLRKCMGIFESSSFAPNQCAKKPSRAGLGRFRPGPLQYSGLVRYSTVGLRLDLQGFYSGRAH